MKSLLLTLFVCILSATASAEKIGNGQVDLAVKDIFEANDGLTVQERIYKLWQEAEGSLPDFQNEDKGCLSGVSVNSFASNYQVQELSDTILCTENMGELKAGPVVVRPAATVGLQFVFDNFPYRGPIDGTFPSKLKDKLTTRINQQTNISRITVKQVKGSAAVPEEYDRGPILLRKIGKNLLVGVILPRAKNGWQLGMHSVYESTKMIDGYCKGASPIYPPNEKPTSKKMIESIGWTTDKEFNIPGVCNVMLFNTRHD